MEDSAGFRFYRPNRQLQPYVRYYWTLTTSETLSALTFPIGCPQIIFHRQKPLFIPELNQYQAPLSVSGQVNFPAHLRSDGGLDMVVAVLHPHAFEAIFGLPASEIYNQEVDGKLLGCRGLGQIAMEIGEERDSALCVGHVERWLLSQLALFSRAYDFSRVGAAVWTLLADPTTSVTDLGDKACLGKKQFERVFRRHVGMNPKEYARIVRFQKTLWMMQRGDRAFADIAFASGYADQSHLIREFRQFSGVTPAQLLRDGAAYSDLFTTPV